MNASTPMSIVWKKKEQLPGLVLKKTVKVEVDK